MAAPNWTLMTETANTNTVKNYCHTGAVEKANAVLQEAWIVNPASGYKRYNKRQALARDLIQGWPSLLTASIALQLLFTDINFFDSWDKSQSDIATSITDTIFDNVAGVTQVDFI